MLLTNLKKRMGVRYEQLEKSDNVNPATSVDGYNAELQKRPHHLPKKCNKKATA